MLRASVLLGLASLLLPGAAAAGEPRSLVVVLDAVPFGAVDELLASDERLFEGFQPVQPLVSSFPSSTSVAMVGLLEPFDLPRSPGYEARFFDWSRREVRGGGLISFFRIEFAWRKFFDWSRKGVVRSAFGGLRPVKTSGTRVERAVEAFFDSSANPYFVYLETTDLAAHLKGPSRLGEVLVRLDAALLHARRRHPEVDFRTVVLSDHGVAGDGGRLVNALAEVRQAARSKGFELGSQLREDGDLVLTPFGLVSSFEAYAGEGRVEAVSSALVGARGVDLCVYRSGDVVVVEGKDGRARIEGWAYHRETADPLGYLPVVERLERSGSAPDGDSWLEETADHAYPDALHRARRAFDLVENPASVVCSLEAGFIYGRTSTEWLARVTGSTVRWTHGALSREATLGFVLTDDERFPGGALRFDRALAPLAAASAPPPRDKMTRIRRP